MLTVAALAVFAHNAMGDGSVGFALSYAAFHLILTWLWWRTGVYDLNHRLLSQPYSSTFHRRDFYIRTLASCAVGASPVDRPDLVTSTLDQQ